MKYEVAIVRCEVRLPETKSWLWEVAIRKKSEVWEFKLHLLYKVINVRNKTALKRKSHKCEK